MKKAWCTFFLAVAGAAFLPALAQAQARINAALLPSSRYVAVGDTATAFVTIRNAGTSVATNCGFSPTTTVDAAFVSFLTDPATNQQILPIQSSADIPAGGVQTFGFAMTPGSAFDPVDVEFSFDCDNTDAARVISGVNTLVLGASDTPGPDIVALAATLASDGIVRAPGPAGTGVFSVATANVGSGGTIRVEPQITDSTTSVVLRICETNPSTGACLSAPAASVMTTTTAGGVNSFGIFARGQGLADLAPASRRVQLRILDEAGQLRGLTSVAYTTQTEMAAGGGRLYFADAEIELDPAAAWAPVRFAITESPAPPAPVPDGTGNIDRTRDITVSDPGRLNAPARIWLNYDPARVNENDLFVLHFSNVLGRYEMATVQQIDRTANRILIDSRNFSEFVTADFNGVLPSSYRVPTFDPNHDRWNIPNFGSYFSPGGNCFGMSTYAVWYSENRPAGAPRLNGAYSDQGGEPTSIAHLTATRAHIAQSRYWSGLAGNFRSRLSAADTARLMRIGLFMTGRPMILGLGTSTSPRHATVLLGWSETGFEHYEVNTVPGLDPVREVPFADGRWGTYDGYTNFTFIGPPSMGRPEDFALLAAEAASGFAISSSLVLTSPQQGQTYTGGVVPVQGLLAGELGVQGTSIAYVNNATPVILSQQVPVISSSVPARAGENTLVVLAGTRGGNRSDWNPSSATIVRSFNSTSQPDDLRATLTWESEADLDLYVGEQSGPTVYPDNLSAPGGLNMILSDNDGYGPEIVTLDALPNNQVSLKVYRISVHNRVGTGPQSGYIDLVLREGSSIPTHWSFYFTITGNGNPLNRDPGSTGSDWACCIEVYLSDSFARWVPQ